MIFRTDLNGISQSFWCIIPSLEFVQTYKVFWEM